MSTDVKALPRCSSRAMPPAPLGRCIWQGNWAMLNWLDKSPKVNAFALLGV